MWDQCKIFEWYYRKKFRPDKYDELRNSENSDENNVNIKKFDQNSNYFLHNINILATNISFKWSYGGKIVFITGSFNNWDAY